MQDKHFWPFVRSLTAALLLCTFAIAASADPGENCGSALASVRAQVTRSDTRRLSRCALAILNRVPGAEVDAMCSILRTHGQGAALTDTRSRKRIERRCRRGLPWWLDRSCPGPGPASGQPVSDARSAASCAVETAHCLAATAAASLFPELENLLSSQNPRNTTFGLGADARVTFSDCLAELPPFPTTTMPGVTTTTTIQAPTTTLLGTTTTVPTPTTTVPNTTTTLVSPTTTVPVITTTTLPNDGTPDLVITEFMSNPAAQSDGTGEYFELHNAGSASVDLRGLTVRDDGSDAFTIDASVVIAPGGYVVLARSATAADGAVDYVYGSSMTLSNSDDEIVLELGGLVIDRLAYGAPFPLEAGRATELKSSALDQAANDDPENWCPGSVELGDGDFGSPGSPSSC